MLQMEFGGTVATVNNKLLELETWALEERMSKRSRQRY